MKILFTGASSFTGMWFVKALSEAGHDVTAIFRSPLESYSGIRRQRVEQLKSICRPIFSCPFGSDIFHQLISDEDDWSLFCHHAADVTNYKSPDFDIAAALANNTKNLKKTLELLLGKGCRKVLLTGSVFEQNEGKGSDNLRAVSPYGLSKGLTAEVFNYYTTIMNMKLGKFVIPNPFGPYEEKRFTTFLIETWYRHETAEVHTPAYIRDNIHASLLAKKYVQFAERLTEDSGYVACHPSSYVETQGAFTSRFAEQMRIRLGIPCAYKLEEQNTFSEPLERINTDKIDMQKLDWNEKDAWDELAKYYAHTYGEASL